VVLAVLLAQEVQELLVMVAEVAEQQKHLVQQEVQPLVLGERGGREHLV
jgi:hypothetical protein